MTGIEKDKETVKCHRTEKEKGENNSPGARSIDREGKKCESVCVH